MINLDKTSNHAQCFFFGKDDDSWLWHRRIAHINMEHLNKLISKDLVIGLPKLKFEKDRLCDATNKICFKRGTHLMPNNNQHLCIRFQLVFSFIYSFN